MKKTYSTLLLVTGFMAVMLMLPFAHLNAEPAGNPNNSPVSLTYNVNQSDIQDFNQSESSLLMAQMTEEHRSSESSSSSTVEVPPPVQENRSSESSSSATMKTTTTEAPPAHCVTNCRNHYAKSLEECNDPHHPHHNKCEKWAREREQSCLSSCN